MLRKNYPEKFLGLKILSGLTRHLCSQIALFWGIFSHYSYSDTFLFGYYTQKVLNLDIKINTHTQKVPIWTIILNIHTQTYYNTQKSEYLSMCTEYDTHFIFEGSNI
jgi:hypothetical protein